MDLKLPLSFVVYFLLFGCNERGRGEEQFCEKERRERMGIKGGKEMFELRNEKEVETREEKERKKGESEKKKKDEMKRKRQKSDKRTGGGKHGELYLGIVQCQQVASTACHSERSEGIGGVREGRLSGM